MKRILFVLLIPLLLCLVTEAKAGSVCEEIFSKNHPPNSGKIQLTDAVTHWYTTLELGYHDKWIERDPKTGRRKLIAFISDQERQFGIPVDFKNVELMPGAPDAASSYYAIVSMDHESLRLSTQLHSIHDTKKLAAFTDNALNLTWDTYLNEGTVGPADIESFKKTENELAPQRKITFVTTPRGSDRPLSVMRVYDGSPYPTSFIGLASTHLEAPDSDPKLPLERRYPHLNLRQSSEYIFEPGRLAKSQDFDGALDFQLSNLGAYLLGKFGFLGVGPTEYVMDGRVYAEITARHVQHYLKPHENGGLGFKLFAMARGGEKMTPVKGNPSYRDLAVDRRDKDARFIVYTLVHELVNNFYLPVITKPTKEAYPELFK